MGIAIPQVITSDRASGAQVIDGSLKFDGSQELTFTPGSDGNLRTATWSFWVKRTKFSSGNDTIFGFGPDAANDAQIYFNSSDKIYIFFRKSSSSQITYETTQVFRDTGWYHIVVSVDTTQASDQIKVYVNGEEVTAFGTSTDTTQNADLIINDATYTNYIGRGRGNVSIDLDCMLSNVYLIDGQRLDASYFGFTDGLTNTWKPKKYEGTFGTNGFWLPMDGNSPIGQDQSGQGNDWTPVNFGGSLELDNPNVSGARPILNTTQGGTQAGVGVFGSKQNVGYAVTVYNDGGGNKYYIDGVKQATLTGLIRGATYTFDTSDSTVSSHPFRFSESDGGSEYTNGVAAITGAATTITVPHDAPNTLYYYCTSHSGMGADITGITTNEKLADQYASNCVLSQPLIGIADDVSASIACTSTTKTITTSGAVASSAFNNFYNGSFFFDGSDDFLSVPDGTYFTVGSDPFTLEFWAYKTSSGEDMFCGSSNSSGSDSSTSYIVQTGGGSPSNSLRAHVGDGSSLTTVNSGIDFVLNKWVHIAFVRDGNTLRLFQDGVQVDTTSFSGTVKDSGDPFYIGRGFGANSTKNFPGYIQDLRFYKGVAKYTSDFVVPATSPDILPDTPSGVSGGSKLTKITDGAVSFDNSGDSLTVADHADFDLGTNSFTIECFAYLQTIGQFNNIFAVGTDSSNGYRLDISTSNNLRLLAQIGGSWSTVITGGTALASDKWYHLVVTRSGNNFDLWVDGIKDTTTVSNSGTITNPTTQLEIGRLTTNSLDRNFHGFISNLRFVNGTALYTSRFTPPTAPLTNVTNTKLLCCQSNTSATASVVEPSGSDGTGYTGNTSAITVTSASLNAGSDTNTVDGNTSTSADIRGAGSFVQLVFPQQQNGTLQVNVANGNDVNDDNIRVFIDGVEGTSFDVSSQQWYTIHTGDFTTVKLEHQGSTTGYIYGFRIGTDGDTIINVSGGITANGDTAATNFNPFNTDIKTVRGQETGYATLNPLDSGHSGGSITFSDGNLKAAFPSASGTGQSPATIYVSSGKWYCEYYLESVSDLTSVQYGIVSPGSKRASYIGKSDTTDQYGWEPEIDRAYNNGNNTTPTGKTFTSQWNVAAMALDLDNGTWEMFIDGVSTGTIYSGISGTYTFAIGDTMGAGYHTHTANFGQKPFKFAPPDGFQPLNTANTRPVKVISRPDQYVGITTWSGDGSSTRNFRDFNFAPDLIWYKERTNIGGNWSHTIFDTVRGDDVRLHPNSNGAETAEDIRFLTDGFGVGNAARQNSSSSGAIYVAWCWKAGGAPTADNTQTSGAMTANSVSVDGVLQSAYTPSGSPSTYPKRMSIGTRQGFSIVQFVGNASNRTLPHGLGKPAKFMIVKNMDTGSTGWSVYHDAIGTGTDNYIELQSAAAASASDNAFQKTAPTSDVFSIGTKAATNNDTDNTIAYIWADVPGLQKFGKYFGNSNADGTYIELGFRPALLIVKRLEDADNQWVIFDSERTKINQSSNNSAYLRSPDTGAEGTANNVDFLSNGFKWRKSDSYTNDSGSSTGFIYAAWAEAPSIDLFGGGANAR